MSVAVIVNPAAGRGRRAARTASYRERLRRRLPDHVEYVTRGPGDEAELTARALQDGHEAILAVGGALQIDVVMARLRDEYGVEARVATLPYTRARWIAGTEEALAGMALLGRARRCVDRDGHPVLLFESAWDVDYCRKQHPDVTFSEVSPAAGP